jgi:hypothetical protein
VKKKIAFQTTTISGYTSFAAVILKKKQFQSDNWYIKKQGLFGIFTKKPYFAAE